MRQEEEEIEEELKRKEYILADLEQESIQMNEIMEGLN